MKTTTLNSAMNMQQSTATHPDPAAPSTASDTTIKANSPETIPSAQAHIFPFMRLPTEIREMIYKLALSAPSPINIAASRRGSITKSCRRLKCAIARSCRTQKFFFPRDSPGRPTSMLLLSRQVYREASAVLYSHNRFSFYGITPATTFVRSIGSINRQWLTRICLCFRAESYHDSFFRSLVNCKRLCELEFHGYKVVADKSGVVRYFRLLKPLMDQVAKEKGDPTAGWRLIKWASYAYVGISNSPDMLLKEEFRMMAEDSARKAMQKKG